MQRCDSLHAPASEFFEGTVTDMLNAQLHEEANRLAKQNAANLLDQLNDLGFSWRDVARVAGVSVPALRKWRLGGSATSQNRYQVATIAALCEMLHHLYLISDVASWLEARIHPEAPVTGLDVMAKGRFDLLLSLARDDKADPEPVLDELEPRWREKYASPVEVFVAPDGMPGLRLSDPPD